MHAARTRPAPYLAQRKAASINGLSPEARIAGRRNNVAPLVDNLMEWMQSEVVKAFD